MKKKYKSKEFLELLKSTPNVSAVCQDLEISRNTVYRWCFEDPEFKAEMEASLKLGVNSINDLAENRLVNHIKNGNLRAIQYWLDNHKKEYIKPRDKNMWQPLIPVTKIEIVGLEGYGVKKVTEDESEVLDELELPSEPLPKPIEKLSNKSRKRRNS